LSDDGQYPDGMLAGETLVTYDGPDKALDQARRCLNDWDAARKMAARGRERIEDMYSKSKQWQHFESIVSSI